MLAGQGRGSDVRLLLFLVPAVLFAVEPPAVTLATVKRVYVEQLGGGQTSDQMRDMIIAAIQSSGLFTLTENADRADAVVRGSSDDRIFTEEHTTSDAVGVHGGTSTGSASGNVMAGSASSHRSVSAGVTDTESSHIQERRHEASASIRMVNPEGDVIWSTTQESNGAKFRSAMADVADRIIRQLTADVRRARQPVPAPPLSPPLPAPRQTLQP